MTEKLSFREAGERDCRMYYDWRNDESVRRVSFNTEKLDYGIHSKWFSERLKDTNTRMYVLMDGGEDVGQVRFDMKGAEAEISVSIAPDKRGRSYGKKGIRMMSEHMLDNTCVKKITAYIKKGNDVSLAAFLSSGYKMTDKACRDKGEEAYKLEYGKGRSGISGGRTYLATTALSDIWDLTGKVVFLGPWCLSGKNKKYYTEGKTVMAEGAHYTTRDLVKNAEYCEKVYAVISRELAGVLNRLHGAEKSRGYWDVVLNPWLIYHIHTMHERYTRMLAALSGRGDVYTHVVDMDADLAPNDTYEFLDKKVDDDHCNLQIISYIALSMGLDCARTDTVKKCACAGKKPLQDSVKSVLKNAIAAGERLVLGDGGVAMVDMYHMDFWDYMSLDAGLKGTVSMERYFPADRRGSFPYDAAMRSALEFKEKDKDPFVNIVKGSIKYAIPRCYVEGYKSTRSYAEAVKRTPPKVIVSATGWYLNDRFKFYAAEMKERGARLIGAQHGGNLGFSRYHSSFLFEKDNKDGYLSWGWGGENDGIKVLPDPYLSKIKDTAEKEKKDFALFISFNYPRYLYKLVSYPGPEGVEKYFEDQLLFFRNIPAALQEKICYRPYPADFGRNVKERVKSVMPGVKWADTGRASDWMRQARLVIVDYPETAFIEALVMNVPLIVFSDLASWPIRDDAREYFDMLKTAGIFYDSPGEAASKAAGIYDDSGSWWQSRRVQDARGRFIQRYGYADKDWRRAWIDGLSGLYAGTKA